MEKYQFGKHLEMEKLLKKKKHYAEVFSEGNPELENLLLNLWKHEIETYMCCTGHEWEDTPYIMMYIPKTKKDMIYKIVNCIYEKDHMMVKLGNEYKKEGIMVDIRSYVSSDFFKDIDDILDKEIPKEKINNDIIEAVELVSNFEYDKFDLYWEMVNGDYLKRRSAFVNYTTEGKEGPTCHLHVLYKNLDKHNNDLFDHDELKEVAYDCQKRKEEKELTRRLR